MVHLFGFLGVLASVSTIGVIIHSFHQKVVRFNVTEFEVFYKAG